MTKTTNKTMTLAGRRSSHLSESQDQEEQLPLAAGGWGEVEEEESNKKVPNTAGTPMPAPFASLQLASFNCLGFSEWQAGEFTAPLIHLARMTFRQVQSNMS